MLLHFFYIFGLFSILVVAVRKQPFKRIITLHEYDECMYIIIRASSFFLNDTLLFCNIVENYFMYLFLEDFHNLFTNLCDDIMFVFHSKFRLGRRRYKFDKVYLSQMLYKHFYAQQIVPFLHFIKNQKLQFKIRFSNANHHPKDIFMLHRQLKTGRQKPLWCSSIKVSEVLYSFIFLFSLKILKNFVKKFLFKIKKRQNRVQLNVYIKP